MYRYVDSILSSLVVDENERIQDTTQLGDTFFNFQIISPEYSVELASISSDFIHNSFSHVSAVSLIPALHTTIPTQYPIFLPPCKIQPPYMVDGSQRPYLESSLPCQCTKCSYRYCHSAEIPLYSVDVSLISYPSDFIVSLNQAETSLQEASQLQQMPSFDTVLDFPENPGQAAPQILTSPNIASFPGLPSCTQEKSKPLRNPERTGIKAIFSKNTKKPKTDDSTRPVNQFLFKCEYPECTQMFSRQTTLRTHLKTHLDLRPYKCERCVRSFSRKHDLQRHIRVHTGEKPYLCKICQRSFARGDGLKRHHKVDNSCKTALEYSRH